MGDGLKSLAIEVAVWVLLLAIFLPVGDFLFARRTALIGPANAAGRA